MTNEIYRHIGEQIRKKRTDLGHPQKWLASEIGLTRASIAKIETGKQRFQIDTLYSIAEKLDLNPFALLPKPGSIIKKKMRLPKPTGVEKLEKSEKAWIANSVAIQRKKD